MSDTTTPQPTTPHVCPSCGNTKSDGFVPLTGKFLCLNRGGHGPTRLVDQMVPADPPPVTLEDIAAYFAIGDDPEDWAGQIRAIQATMERLETELAEARENAATPANCNCGYGGFHDHLNMRCDAYDENAT